MLKKASSPSSRRAAFSSRTTTGSRTCSCWTATPRAEPAQLAPLQARQARVRVTYEPAREPDRPRGPSVAPPPAVPGPLRSAAHEHASPRPGARLLHLGPRDPRRVRTHRRACGSSRGGPTASSPTPRSASAARPAKSPARSGTICRPTISGSPARASTTPAPCRPTPGGTSPSSRSPGHDGAPRQDRTRSSSPAG